MFGRVRIPISQFAGLFPSCNFISYVNNTNASIAFNSLTAKNLPGLQLVGRTSLSCIPSMFSVSKSEELGSCIDGMDLRAFTVCLSHLTKSERIKFLRSVINSVIQMNRAYWSSKCLPRSDGCAVWEGEWLYYLPEWSHYGQQCQKHVVPPLTMLRRSDSFTNESSFFIFINVDFCQPCWSISGSISSRRGVMYSEFAARS
jgi:hypothetical protein